MKLLKKLILPFTSHKYLLYQLTQREIKARYKQSFIGYAWVMLNPLAQMMVYTFVFSVIFKFPTGGIPYPVFLFAALLPWTTLQVTLNTATQSLVSNAILLKKVWFPREIIPYSVVISKMIDFGFSSFVFFGLMLFYRVPLSKTTLLFIPLFLIQIILMTGMSFFLSTFNLFYRDIQYLTNLMLMVWMYLTPVVYPMSMVPDRFIFIYKLNPMVGLVEGYRAALFSLPFEPVLIVQSLFVSIFIFITGYLTFKKSEKVFADIV